MTATTFTTQRQLMSKNMPADALSGPYAQQQKMLLYVLPVVFAVGGIAFPIGVLFYWTTSNLWTMGQQFYVIRNNPAPGTPAFEAKEERDAEKARQAQRRQRRRTGDAVERGETAAAAPAERQQPQRQSKCQRQPKKRRRQPAPTSSQRERTGTTDRREERPMSELPSRRRDRRPGGRPTTDSGHDARPPSASPTAGSSGSRQEGDIAADYLEELLDIADLDGDLDMDVEGDRAAVSIVGAELTQLVGRER